MMLEMNLLGKSGVIINSDIGNPNLVKTFMTYSADPNKDGNLADAINEMGIADIVKALRGSEANDWMYLKSQGFGNTFDDLSTNLTAAITAAGGSATGETVIEAALKSDTSISDLVKIGFILDDEYDFFL